MTMKITPDQEERLQQLMAAFLMENEKINLSAYRTIETCWAGNVLDSAAGAYFLKECAYAETPLSCMDIGTGGGFPLLPLAILFPHMKFTGLDATNKKIDAIRRIVIGMDIANVDLRAGRAEEIGHLADYRERFDIATSRAVAALPSLLEYMSPFVRIGGRLFCWKSLTIEDELEKSVSACRELRCRLIDRYRYTLPGDWGERQILVFEKTGILPEEYPRETGIPGKKPL